MASNVWKPSFFLLLAVASILLWGSEARNAKKVVVGRSLAQTLTGRIGTKVCQVAAPVNALQKMCGDASFTATDPTDCRCDHACYGPPNQCCNNFVPLATNPCLAETCRLRCGAARLATDKCSCDPLCVADKKCCGDFELTCPTRTCNLRCAQTVIDATMPCQCDPGCVKRKDCCGGYIAKCDTGLVCPTTVVNCAALKKKCEHIATQALSRHAIASKDTYDKCIKSSNLMAKWWAYLDSRRNYGYSHHSNSGSYGRSSNLFSWIPKIRVNLQSFNPFHQPPSYSQDEEHFFTQNFFNTLLITEQNLLRCCLLKKDAKTIREAIKDIFMPRTHTYDLKVYTALRMAAISCGEPMSCMLLPLATNMHSSCVIRTCVRLTQA